MNITSEELGAIVSDFVQIGMLQAIKAIEPVGDHVRQSDVTLWLQLNSIDGKQFKQLKRNGKIKPFRLGTARNSPLYYSKAEIIEAMAYLRLNKLNVNDKIGRIKL